MPNSIEVQGWVRDRSRMIAPALLSDLRAAVARGAGHDCFEWLTGEIPICQLCDRMVEDIRGPKLAEVRAAIQRFNAVGLHPYLAADDEPEGEFGYPPDVRVAIDGRGTITDVVVTETGMARLAAAGAGQESSDAITRTALDGAFARALGRVSRVVE